MVLKIDGLLAYIFLKNFSVDTGLDVKKKTKKTCSFMATTYVGSCFSSSGFKSVKRLVSGKL